MIAATLSCLLLGMIFLQGCTRSHIIDYREDVSRDCTTITFAHNRSPYVHRSQVGGEHISTVNVLGFEGEVFDVQLTADAGNVMSSICGEGICIDDHDLPGGIRKAARIVNRESIFSVDPSAHPYADYELKITRR